MSKKHFTIYTLVNLILGLLIIVLSIKDKSTAYLPALILIFISQVLSLAKYKKSDKNINDPAAFQVQNISNPNIIHSKLRGVTFNCEKNSNINRQNVVAKLKENEKLTVERYEYNGEPAIMLLNSKGLDVGNFSADMAKKLYNKEFDVFVSEITGGNGKTLGCNIIIKLLWFNQLG